MKNSKSSGDLRALVPRDGGTGEAGEVHTTQKSRNTAPGLREAQQDERPQRPWRHGIEQPTTFEQPSRLTRRREHEDQPGHLPHGSSITSKPPGGTEPSARRQQRRRPIAPASFRRWWTSER